MAVIAILSGKGGVGKTTLTTNLATSLSNDFKRKVVVLDTNVSSAHVGLHFGIYEDLQTTLPDVMKKRQSIEKAVYEQTETGVDIVPSSVAINEDVNLRKIKNYILQLAASPYDYVLVDCAPGYGVDVFNAIKAADEVIIVTTPNIPDVSDAMKLVEQLRGVKKKKVRLVLNRVTGEKYELDTGEIKSRIGFQIHSVVPEDKSVPESIANGMPVVMYDKYSRPSIEIKKLAASVAGEKYKPPGFFERLRDAFAGAPERPKQKVRLKTAG